MNESMDSGQQIIDAIISGGLCDARCAHNDDHGCIVVWSSGAAEQLSAVVANSMEVQASRRLAELFGEALRLAGAPGAPDGNDPAELLEWAQQAGKRLKQ